MRPRARKIGPAEVVLPRGSRVLLVQDRPDADGVVHAKGTACVVREVAHHTYVVETPTGARLRVQRDHLRLQKEELLEALGARQWEHRRLKDEVILATVVGSRAWGLADADSDEDVRGCFVLPFEAHAGLWDAPDEIRDEISDATYGEIEKTIHQGLRADANTLEMLWSPHMKIATPLGRRLVDRRRMFASMNVLGSFGRYATSQFEKVRRSLARDAALTTLLDALAQGRVADEKAAQKRLPPGEHVHQLVRSLYDRGLLEASSFDALAKGVAAHGADRFRPEEVRPKNAYNLVRLLASCESWLRTGEPLVLVEGALAEVLLSIKRGALPIEEVLRLAAERAAAVEDAARDARLPESPDFQAAHETLSECRREAARRAFALAPPTIPGDPPPSDAFAPTFFPTRLPDDVDPGSTRRFLERFVVGDLSIRPRAFLVVALTGAHAYGFPSVDSDLDLKAIDAAPPSALLGLEEKTAPVEHVEVFEGREMDLSSHEAGLAVRLLLKGNGNMLERLLGPLPIATTPAGLRLAALAQASLSKRVLHHYRGFFGQMRREYAAEEARGLRRAKRLLYAYRVALTGAHLLLERELVMDVAALAERWGFPLVPSLIARKRAAEKHELSAEDAALHVADLDRLAALLDDAARRSPLPDAPPNERDLDAFLIEVRSALR